MFILETLLLFALAPIHSYAYAPFSVLSGYKETTEEKPITFDNVPPYKTQDGLGNCFSATTAAYLDMLNCKALKTDCSTLDDSQLFSRLMTGKFAGVKNKPTSEKDYSGIMPEFGANPFQNLKNILKNGLCAPTQKCASLDKALTHFSDTESFRLAKGKIFDQLENKHKTLNCPTCASTITAADEEEIKNLTNSLQLKNGVDALKAFTESSYSVFLEKILAPENCTNDIRCYDGPENISLEQFPEEPIKGNPMVPTMTKIKQVLKTNTPLILNRICNKANGPCSKNDPNYHTLIVTGYRKVCKDPKTQKDCRETLKVYNSYGATWQKEHSDGWVDAEQLLKSTNYEPGILTWVANSNSRETASR